MDGAEARASRSALRALQQVLDRREQPQRLELESKPLVSRACVLVRHLDPEGQYRSILLVAQPDRGLADQLARCPLAPGVGHDVDVAQVADTGMIDLRQCKT